MSHSYTYIIVGSGIAGLYAALLAREHGSVLVLTKGSIDDSNTRYAQGGIAAPIGPDDSPQSHLADTVAAGAGLVDEEAARVLTSEAGDRIHDLVRFGVPFDSLHGEIALAREGAHSVPRVLHAGGDATGAHIELTLSSVARQEGITVLEHTIATEILSFVLPEVLSSVRPEVSKDRDASAEAEVSKPERPQRVTGIRALNTKTGETTEYECRRLILATGGAGQLFRVSTNPPVATGDGIALAYRAGAEITDMEFFQFHPTALRMPGVQSFLISEAVRGEGGVLRDTAGVRFMPDYHDLAELAPRDVVARAILDRMAKTGADHVLLDVTHLDPALVVARFPQIYRFCLEAGLDITKEPVPVSPAAHYTMGGVRTNTWGETTLPGLYAVGECACTGVHGANRLASNSLLETVVFAKRAVQRTLDYRSENSRPSENCHFERSEKSSPSAATSRIEDERMAPSPDAFDLSAPTSGNETPPLTREALQDLMWRDVGIVRSRESLTRARAALSDWSLRTPDVTDRASQELADMLVCARLMTEAALIREESRGAHYRTDFPEPRDEWLRHIVFRRGA